MAGKGEGFEDNAAKLEKRIGCVKYTLFCFNVVAWCIWARRIEKIIAEKLSFPIQIQMPYKIFGAALFGVSVWIRAEPGFEEWITILNIQVYYIGVYVLIGASIIMMVISFLGCVSALMENTFALLLFVGTQILSFVLACAGSAVLLDYSTMNSSVQPLIRDTMMRLIMTSEYPSSSSTLKMIQENIGCCGADGANDYILLKQPLPAECRDTVTGNAFFHGCVEELTWLLEDKSGWIVGIAMSIAMINVVGAVMSIILTQAIKKEEEEARNYRR